MRRLGLLLAVALVLGACSDDEPPQWLRDRANAAVPTTAPPSTTIPPVTTTAPGGGDRVAAIELDVGDCVAQAPFTTPEVTEVSLASVIDCAEEHTAEVYARFDLRLGPDAPFPGGGETRQRAQQQCRERFQGFVGRPWTQSELDIAALWPTRTSWGDGDRSVTCTVFRADGAPLTGTAENSQL